jgi:hypothetical protein
MSYSGYVDHYSDLSSVWNKIQGDTKSTEYKYWSPKGATSKEEFGRLHWSEAGESEGRSLTSSTPTNTGTNTSTGTHTNTATNTATNTSTTTIPDPVYTPPTEPTTTDETGYGQSAVSGMPTLGAPPDISDPAQRTVNPQELVEFRMTKMMQQDNAYMAQAVTMAKQHANQSGMLNTSMAASAGVDAALKSILPIAQQDAATLFTQGLENQKVVNEFLMQDYLMKSNFQLTEYGAQNTTYNAALQRAHEKNESALIRYWQAQQNTFDRELTIWKDKYNAALQKVLSSMQTEAGEGENQYACHTNAQAHFNSVVAAIEAQYATAQINEASRDHQLKAAENNLKSMLAACG